MRADKGYPRDFEHYLLYDHALFGKGAQAERRFTGRTMHHISRAGDGRVAKVELAHEFLDYLDGAREHEARDKRWKDAARLYTAVEDAIGRMIDAELHDLVEVLRYYQTPVWLRRVGLHAVAERIGCCDDQVRRLRGRAIRAAWRELGCRWPEGCLPEASREPVAA